MLAAVESQLAPDGGDGFLGAVSGFYDAWASVGVGPTDLSARDGLLVAADQLSFALRGADARLGDAQRFDPERPRATLGQANSLMEEMASLNLDIRRAGAQGGGNLDALDRRDLIMDELSGLAPFTFKAQEDGTVTATIDGMIGVQGGESRPYRLAVPPTVSEPSVFAEGASRPLRLDAFEGGAIGAQLGVLTKTMPDTRAALDAIASSIVTAVNTVALRGRRPRRRDRPRLFRPVGVTAATIGRDPALTAETIAAGNGGAGDSSVATAITGQGRMPTLAPSTCWSMSACAPTKRPPPAEASAAYVDHASALRDGVSKVSIDEEMTNLIRFQQSYAASARVIQTANQMFDTLLAM